ncbi:unnamed protein product [Ceutorhynchus assimilis]|uniref:F-box domain-containing protein n=1 Tax=Ceutorhynchus assimilis TaxID=467358 RepID=A0A9N9M932_9CUCU|nr:unnamed protein product [Ceutorhynchus assimilis]
MNHSSNLLEGLSPRPKPCPLVRLGPNHSSTDDTKPSTDGREKYQPFKYDQYSRQNGRMFHDEHASSAAGYDLQKLHASSDESDYMQTYYDRQSHSYLSEDPDYGNKSSHAPLARTNLKYAKGSMDLSSLCLSSPYWENDLYESKESVSDKSSNQFYHLSPNQSHDSSFLFDNFEKMGKSSPSLDQGYATLVTPGGSSSASLWNEGNIYQAKRFQPKNNFFDTLSDQQVIKIFTYLNSIDLSTVAQVCRRFDALAWTPSLWRTIIIEGEYISGDKAIKGVLRQLCGQDRIGACPTVERVHIRNGARICDKTLVLLSKRCPELRHLQIQGCMGVTNNALFEIATRCANLQHLDVAGCMNISYISVNAVADVNRRMQLQYLDLTDCVAIQDIGLRIIVQNCPLLAFLYLRRCFNITDAGLKYVPSFCSGLRELSVSDCSKITDFGLYELAKLGPMLRYLSVAKCDQVSDAGLKVIARKCYKLRYLNARGCEAVSDDAITVVARSCTRLRALDIGKCDVSDAGLRALAESCPNLKKLSIRNCELVTDRGVQCISYYCRGLQLLNIQDCQISLEGYRAVKKYCKRCVIELSNPGFF